MEELYLYFKEGWQHIISTDALDHQLFIIAMAVLFMWKDWRRVLILVTAFTIGHSLTLALSVYDVIRFDSSWVEFLIPCTIVLTAANNFRFLKTKEVAKQQVIYNYIMALGFGLIHGMGFANSIRMMLASDQNIGGPLLSFNIGLEIGQILLITIILMFGQFLIGNMRLNRKYWIIILSVVTLIISFIMAINRVPGN